MKNKRGQEIVGSHSSDFKTSSENFVISDESLDQVGCCNMKQFSSYSKNYIC